MLIKHAAKYLLFNNPEQAENLKRRVVFILRNKNEIYDVFESLKSLQLTSNCDAVASEQ